MNATSRAKNYFVNSKLVTASLLIASIIAFSSAAAASPNPTFYTDNTDGGDLDISIQWSQDDARSGSDSVEVVASPATEDYSKVIVPASDTLDSSDTFRYWGKKVSGSGTAYDELWVYLDTNNDGNVDEYLFTNTKADNTGSNGWNESVTEFDNQKEYWAKINSSEMVESVNITEYHGEDIEYFALGQGSPSSQTGANDKKVYLDDATYNGNDLLTEDTGTVEVRQINNVDTGIQTNVEAALPGDKVAVEEGTYEEAVLIDTEGLELVSKGTKQNTVVDANGDGPVVRVNAPNVLVEGFTLTGATGDGEAGQGIAVSAASSDPATDADGTVLRNLTVEDNYDRGVVVDYSENVEFRNIISRNNYDRDGLSGDTPEGGFEDNGEADGFTVWHSNNTVLKNVRAINNSDNGIYVKGDSNTLKKGVARNNGDEGIDISSDESMGHDHAGGATVMDVISNRNTAAGIEVEDDETGVSITGATVENNPYGLLVADNGNKTEADDAQVSIRESVIQSNSQADVANSGKGTLDATLNYWGAAKPDFQNRLEGDVDYQPWYATSDMNQDVVTKVGDSNDVRAYSGEIQPAVDAAEPGDTVEVSAGTYNEQVNVEKTLEIDAANGAVLEGPGTTGNMLQSSYLIVRGQNDLNLTGLEFRGPFSDSNTAGLLVLEGATVRADGLTMEKMFDEQNGGPSGAQYHHAILVGNKRYGASISGVSREEGTLELTDSSINEFGKAAVSITGNSSEATIRNVNVTGSGTINTAAQDTILVDGANVSLVESSIEDVRYEGSFTAGTGISVYGPSNVEVRNNSFNDVAKTISVQAFRDFDDTTGPVEDLVVEGNEIQGAYFAVDLYSESIEKNRTVLRDSVIRDNEFVGNNGGIGANTGEAVNVDVVGNKFETNSIQMWQGERTFEPSVILYNNEFDRAVVVDRPGNSLLSNIWSSVQDAEDASQEGDTINVTEGTYDESVVVDTNVTLVGGDDSMPTVSPTDSTPAFELTESGATLRGFDVKAENGVKVSGATSFTVENNDIWGPGVEALDYGYGVCVDGVNATSSEQSSISGNHIWTYQKGVELYNSKNVVVEDNRIEDISEGTSDACGGYLTETGAEGAAVGVSTGIIAPETSGKSEDIQVRDNTLVNADYGVVLDDEVNEQLYLQTIENVDITGNFIERNNVGIQLNGGNIKDSGAHDNVIRDNVAYGVRNDNVNLTFDATENCWGHPSGPSGEGSGQGDRVSENVTFDPWKTCVDQGRMIDIDVKPETIRNNPGVMSVQVLNTSEFDPSSLEADTARLGTQQEVDRYRGAEPRSNGTFEDVNDDNMTDLVLKFNRQDVSLSTSLDRLYLVGYADGETVQGADNVTVVAPPSNNGNSGGDGDNGFAENDASGGSLGFAADESTQDQQTGNGENLTNQQQETEDQQSQEEETGQNPQQDQAQDNNQAQQDTNNQPSGPTGFFAGTVPEFVQGIVSAVSSMWPF